MKNISIKKINIFVNELSNVIENISNIGNDISKLDKINYIYDTFHQVITKHLHILIKYKDFYIIVRLKDRIKEEIMSVVNSDEKYSHLLYKFIQLHKLLIPYGYKYYLLNFK